MKYVIGLVKVLVIFIIASLAWLLFSLQELRTFLPYSFHLSGMPFGSRTYVVLLQNNAELRPNGGFITAFARVKMFSGIITDLQIDDVFSLTGHDDDIEEEAPYPMGELLAGPFYKGHNFHDANWYPDLPSSAADILKFYKMEFPEDDVDGVITVNFSVIEDLFDFAAPIRYGDKELTKANLFHTIEYEQNNIDRHNEAQLAERKGILKEIFPILIKKLAFNLPKYKEMAHVLVENMNSKDISFYFKDPVLQEVFTERGWTQTFPTPEENRDIFAVVEANLGGMKSDRYLRRNYHHKVEYAEPGQISEESYLKATSQLTFTHMGDYNPPLSHEYIGFIRAYAPLGSSLLTEDPNIITYEELGYTVFGKIIRVPPQTSYTLEFQYTMPTSVVGHNAYNLYLFHQSGIEHTQYSVEFSAPIDHILTSHDFVSREQIAYFSEELEHDKNISLRFSGDETPPRITHQEFVDYNRLIVQFNEPVLKFDCENTANYDLIDTDKNVKDVNNRPTIRNIRCDERQATIYTRSIRTQYNEAFELEVRNIRDRSNNIISPNPMTITIYQRFDRDKDS